LLDVENDRTRPNFGQYLGTPNMMIDCIGNCLQSAIALSQATVAGVLTITGQVTVQSEARSPVSGVTVVVRWTLPNGSTREETGITDTTGLVSFVTVDGTGIYQFSVINLAKRGYSFDAIGSTLTNSITG
jgi:hypothetical protein